MKSWVIRSRQERVVEPVLSGIRKDAMETACKAGLYGVPCNIEDIIRPRLEELAFSLFGRIDTPVEALLRREAELSNRLNDLDQKVQARCADLAAFQDRSEPPIELRTVVCVGMTVSVLGALAGLAMHDVGCVLGQARIAALVLASLLAWIGLIPAARKVRRAFIAGQLVLCFVLARRRRTQALRRLREIESSRVRQEQCHARIEAWVAPKLRMLLFDSSMHEQLAAQARVRAVK
jgi:hypothetical protein